MSARRTGDRPAAVARALAFIRDPGAGRFEDAALAVFAFQYERNVPYRRLCDRRGATPATVTAWVDIPPVPAAAFREAALTCGPPARVFTTSGTTGGGEKRGRHLLPETALYEAAWGEPFRRHLLPDRGRMRILSLIPPGALLPGSSLSFMADRILERFGAPGSGIYLGEGGLRFHDLRRALAEAPEPVMLLGTALGYHELLAMLQSSGDRVRLPAGSRLMDTGGFKGRRREVAREDLLDRYREFLGIPSTHVVGEYGMTELSSQFYETSLRDAAAGESGERLYAGPPWVRTRALDPDTLAPLPEGKTGILAHLDLANAWSVCAVATEDLGAVHPGGLRLRGRARGAELRGCSLATEELLGG